MTEARAPKFRFAQMRIENDPWMNVAIGYLLLQAFLNALSFVLGILFILGAEPPTVARSVGILISPAIAYGYFWTARELEARRKRAGYVLIALVVLGALPLLDATTTNGLTFIFTGLGALVVAMIWKYLD
ncbi:MAG TPA: hypothetical protein VM099_16670 [Gemmatimonadaceae bacterium]|nr:hypothetical protein [Gemmatimonadaceae bacterium]